MGPNCLTPSLICFYQWLSDLLESFDKVLDERKLLSADKLSGLLELDDKPFADARTVLIKGIDTSMRALVPEHDPKWLSYLEKNLSNDRGVGISLRDTILRQDIRDVRNRS